MTTVFDRVDLLDAKLAEFTGFAEYVCRIFYFGPRKVENDNPPPRRICVLNNVPTNSEGWIPLRHARQWANVSATLRWLEPCMANEGAPLVLSG